MMTRAGLLSLSSTSVYLLVLPLFIYCYACYGYPYLYHYLFLSFHPFISHLLSLFLYILETYLPITLIHCFDTRLRVSLTFTIFLILLIYYPYIYLSTIYSSLKYNLIVLDKILPVDDPDKVYKFYRSTALLQVLHFFYRVCRHYWLYSKSQGLLM